MGTDLRPTDKLMDITKRVYGRGGTGPKRRARDKWKVVKGRCSSAVRLGHSATITHSLSLPRCIHCNPDTRARTPKILGAQGGGGKACGEKETFWWELIFTKTSCHDRHLLFYTPEIKTTHSHTEIQSWRESLTSLFFFSISDTLCRL